MDLYALTWRVCHGVTALHGQAYDLWQVVRQARNTEPIAQVTTTDVFQEQQWLTVDHLHKMGLDDVGMRLEIDPGLRCLDETLSDGRMPGHPCLLQCLDRIGQLGLMVVDNIHEPHTSGLDVVDFPTILNAVTDMPEGYHCCHLLLMCYVKASSSLWSWAGVRRQPDAWQFSTVRSTLFGFGNSDDVRPGRTPVQGHLGQGLVYLGRHLL